MRLVVVGKGGTLGALLAARLGAPAIELRQPDPRVSAVVPELAEADVVVNAGGPRVRPGLDWADYFREHVGVTMRIARSLRPGAHLVHLGSTAVYGARGTLLGPEDVPAPTLFPSPAYAAAKLSAELAAVAAGCERELRVTVLRPSMVYGPGVDSALESLRRLGRRGVGLELRPRSLRQHLTHVELLVAAVRRAAQQGGPSLPRTLLVADPFVLRNEDLRCGRVRVPVPLDLVASGEPLARRFGLGGMAETFRVLALDNEFDAGATWGALGLDPAEFARARTFDPYWREAA
jgi:nucleoside-diphosphate-sugar epimerase